MMDLKNIDPTPYSVYSLSSTEYLVKKYSFRLGTKDEKYRVYK